MMTTKKKNHASPEDQKERDEEAAGMPPSDVSSAHDMASVGSTMNIQSGIYRLGFGPRKFVAFGVLCTFESCHENCIVKRMPC